MIVDDHAAFRQALAVLMERWVGFEVCVEVASTTEALRGLKALEGGLDLAIVDLDLSEPGTEGLIRELREGASGATAVLGLTTGRGATLAGTSGVLGMDVPAEEILVAARQLVG